MKSIKVIIISCSSMLVAFLLFFMIQNVSYLNGLCSENTEGTFYQLSNVLILNSTSAHNGGGAMCSGKEVCDVVNGNHFNTLLNGNVMTCCGVMSETSGNKGS